MWRYSTFDHPKPSLFTHGLAVGRQSGDFKNGVYFGFGTEIGNASGTDTLHRYELSWQFLWTPLGPDAMVSPHLGFRLGGTIFSSQFLTGDSAKTAFVAAILGGLDVQVNHYVSVNAGLGYDANVGPDLPNGASISGYSIDFGAAVRF
jgi:hypothetical protein